MLPRFLLLYNCFMALYTGKGDAGTTKTIDTPERISKSSTMPEALGNLDELNSFLGVVKVKAEEFRFEISGQLFEDIVEKIQQNIFIISAGLAGSDKKIEGEKIKDIENIIAEAEKELPPITKFTIAGGTALSAMFDFARTLARRAERRVVAVNEEKQNVPAETLKYLNRLSSILFALARLSNLRSGIKEDSPSYN
jgi:cob(I)alamin adenosyltransferase